MKQYVEISPTEKLKLLKKHSMGAGWNSLDDKRWCLHCPAEFNGQSVRVYTDGGAGMWLECGTPECDGSPVDWAHFPWWDPGHPLTKAADAELDRSRKEAHQPKTKKKR